MSQSAQNAGQGKGAGTAWGQQSVIRGARGSLDLSGQDVMLFFVVDISGSMKEKTKSNLSEMTKLKAVRLALKETFRDLKSFKNADKFIINTILFATDAWVAKQNATVSEMDAADLKVGKFNSIFKCGSTAIGKGLRVAHDTFLQLRAEMDKQVNRIAVFILLTDGAENQDSQPLETAQELRRRGHLVFCIGFGDNADKDLLKKMASKEEWYGEADDLQSLIEQFKSASRTASRVLGIN
jgi:uncharacterized protein YegL